MGDGLATTPNDEAARHEYGAEGEVGNPLTTGEGVDIQEANQANEEQGKNSRAHVDEYEAEGNGATGQEDWSQHLVVKNVEGVIQQTKGFVD